MKHTIGGLILNYNKEFGRVLIPLLTPFNEEYNVDYGKLEELVDYVLSNNYCDSLIISGTNGEFYSLSLKERKNLFEAAKEYTEGRVPLIAGTGTNFTNHTISLTQRAEELGYDGAMILPPYYGKPTQSEIRSYFLEVASKTELPIILYNIPIFTGVNIKPDTTARLSKIENIVAIKEEAGVNPIQSTETNKKTPDTFKIYSGDDVMALQILLQGGYGVVSGGSHIVGDLMREQINNFLEGEIERSKELYSKTFRLFEAFTQGDRTNPVPLTKEALRICGMDVGKPRPPLKPATQQEKNKLEEILRDLEKV